MTTLQLRPAGDGRTMIMTDHEGRALPGQVAVEWEHGEPGSYPTARITFAVDGRNIIVCGEAVSVPAGTLPEALAAWAALSEANKVRFLKAAEPSPHAAGLERLKAAFADFAATVERMKGKPHVQPR